MANNPVIGRWRKQPAESLRYEVDWTKWLLPGEYLTGAFVAVRANTIPIPLDLSECFFLEPPSGSAGPHGCVYFARAGMSGFEYQVTHWVTTSSGQTAVREILYEVEGV